MTPSVEQTGGGGKGEKKDSPSSGGNDIAEPEGVLNKSETKRGERDWSRTPRHRL